MSTLSPPSNALQVVHITSITAALARLNLKISTDDILDVIQEEEEVRNNKLIVLSGFSLGSTNPFPPVGKFIPDPSDPTDPKPSTNEHPRLLLELAEETSSDSKVPDPFLSFSWLKSIPEVGATKLPFIRASRIVVKNARDTSANGPTHLIENADCLWDTGAQCSYILTDRLPANVRDDQDEGVALMSIDFENIDTTIEAFIYFRPKLPNGSTFIVLGQHSLLARLHYTIQPVDLSPDPERLLEAYPQAYGQIQLVSWRNLDGDMVLL